MKKLTVLLLTAVLCMQLAACGEEDTGSRESGSVQESQGGAGEQSGEDQSAQDGNSQESSEGGGSQGVDAQGDGDAAQELKALRDAVAEVMGDDYWPDSEMAPEFLADYGLTEDMYDAFLGEMPMISVNVDTLILIKAKEGQVDAVEAVLNNYRDTLVADTMQYPMNLGKIQASRIEVVGSYVCFVQLGADVTEGMDIGDEEIIRLCQEQNELAITAIEKAAAQ